MARSKGRDKRRGIPARESGRGDRRTTPSRHPSFDENLIDETIDDTFPASDPPAWTGTSLGEPCRIENDPKENG
jgi:hypothetical protein